MDIFCEPADFYEGAGKAGPAGSKSAAGLGVSSVIQEEVKQEEPEGQQYSEPPVSGYQSASGMGSKAGHLFKRPVDEPMGMESANHSDFEDITDKLKFPKRNRKPPTTF